MKWKKVLVMLLTFSMLSTVACGSDKNDEGTDSSNTGNKVESQVPEETEVKVSLGKLSESIYESNSMGLGWTLPKEWVFFTEEERQQMNEATWDTLEETTDIQINEGEVLCDMMAMSPDGSASMNIQIEKLSALSLGLGALSENAYIKAYIENSIEPLKEALIQMGYTNVDITESTVMIAGKECLGLDMTLEYSGSTLYQRQALIKKGNYLYIITAAGIDKTVLENLFANFYKLS